MDTTELEKAAIEHSKQAFNGLVVEDNIIAFIAGAKWQKEQMMKEAFVVDYVNVDDGRIELEGMPLPCLNPIILLPYPQFQPGDKVRIIVVKVEEE